MYSVVKKIRSSGWIAILLALGIWMVFAQDQFDAYRAQGRNRLFKMILQYLWGMPTGIGIILVSVGAGAYAILKKDSGEMDEENDDKTQL